MTTLTYLAKEMPYVDLMPRRGDIFYIFKHASDGVEIQQGRPAIIVSNNASNATSQFVQVVYLTTKEKKYLPTHVKIASSKYPSTALCEQVSTVDKMKLSSKFGRCTAKEMRAVDEALKISLGLI